MSGAEACAFVMKPLFAWLATTMAVAIVPPPLPATDLLFARVLPFLLKKNLTKI